MKKIRIIFAIFLLLLGGCAKKEEKIEVKDLAIEHETEFGGVYLKMTIDEFNEKGFSYGDSVDVIFSNGYTLEDVPYYNGYYVNAGEPLLVAYPGYDYIKAAINYGDDLWNEADLQFFPGAGRKEHALWAISEVEEHDTANVRLREKGKYADVQTARDIHYYDERERYPSDAVFANFREMKMGDLKENTFYRSASPCDNQHKRATYVNALIEEHGINAILDLADSDARIEGYISADDFDCPYFLSLYEEDRVIPLALNMNYLSEDFARKIAAGLVGLTQFEGPYLVHCTEGKDRTGFVCILIEALAGADYQEIVDDYMLTYDNYYEISETKDKVKYDLIKAQNVDEMLKFIVSDDSVDIDDADLAPYARNYLLKAGMNNEQIDAFLNRITK